MSESEVVKPPASFIEIDIHEVVYYLKRLQTIKSFLESSCAFWTNEVILLDASLNVFPSKNTDSVAILEDPKAREHVILGLIAEAYSIGESLKQLGVRIETNLQLRTTD